MGRVLRNGVTGQPGFGQVSFSASTITTTQTNTDLTLDPEGTGIVKVANDLQLNAQGDLRFADADSSNWVAFQSPATVSTNVTWTLPSVDGAAGTMLRTDGSGTLSWVAPSITMASETSSGSTFYPMFTSSATGSITTSYSSAAKLEYVPSSGTLIANIVQGSTSSGANLVLRSTSNATKGQVYIDETTASSTTATGALRVGGGVGVGGQLTAATIVETSSIVFKENVEPITGALNSVLQLLGVTYDRKDIERHEAGLIAEEVYKIIPEVVSKDENGKPYGISYTKLVAYMVEAIKDLHKEVVDLKSKLG